jgi:predicted dehydrogenase
MTTERRSQGDRPRSNRPVGVAIIGTGYWGVNYVRVFRELAGAELVVVCDQREHRLGEIERQFPGIRTTTSLETALAMDGVDAAVICTPAASHFAVTRQCIEAGKHILVEKPIATTVADSNELIKLAELRRVSLMVGHTFMFNAGIRKVKEYVERDEIGRVYYLYSRRTNLGPIRNDVNALWDLAPHDISIFNYLLDAVPTWVSAVGTQVLNNGREDVGFISLGYGDGIVAHIHVSWADPHKVREMVVVGSEKRIVFDDLGMPEQVRVYEKGLAPAPPEAANFQDYHFQIRDGAIISPRIDVSEPLKNQCTHFIDCVTHGKRPLTSGTEGRDVVAVLEAIDRSMARHGAPVDVQLDTAYPLSNGNYAASAGVPAH